jgi:hypothetical protein
MSERWEVNQDRALICEQQRQFMEQHKNADTFSYDLDGILVSAMYLSPIQKWKAPISVPGSPWLEALYGREWFADDKEGV